MGKKLCIMFVSLVLLVVACCAFAATAPEGFRGIKWGTPISEFKDLEHSNNVGDRLKMYTRNGDKLSVGNVPLMAIYYDFIDEKFTGVNLVLNMDSRRYDLIKILERQYGPFSEQRGQDTFLWNFDGDGSEKTPFVISAEPIEVAAGVTVYRVRYFSPSELEYMLLLNASGAGDL